MGTLEVAISTLELVSIPPGCVHQSTCWQWLRPSWSETGPGSETVPFSPCAHALVGNLFPASMYIFDGKDSLRLSGEQHPPEQKGWRRSPVLAGRCTGFWQTSHSPRQLSICCLCTVIWSKQDRVCALEEWNLSFSQLSSEPHWFSNQLMGLFFLVSDPRAGVPNV